MSEDNEKKSSFEEAGEKPETSLVGEVFSMLKENKKFWMIPIIVVLLGLGLLAVLGGGSAAAPFIYTLF